MKNIFNCLEQKYSNEFVQKLKSTPENEVIKKFYPKFRGDFYSISKEIKLPKKLFEPRGIESRDQQSFIILIAWYRKINSRPLDLDNLINKAFEEQELVKDCLYKKESNAETVFRKHKLGDTVFIKLPVVINETGVKSTVYYNCPTYNSWPDTSNNLLIKGIIVGKDSSLVNTYYALMIKVDYLGNYNTKFFYREIKKNDTIQIDLVEYGLLF
jgi:hypothetical protein